ncbi:MAG: hypothetical protein QXM68_00360 [Candidatus Aenigmatarchaeota archaeon]|nr:hypothetical protein [Candidatus Aenigmarchaeota archaeon]
MKIIIAVSIIAILIIGLFLAQNMLFKPNSEKIFFNEQDLQNLKLSKSGNCVLEKYKTDQYSPLEEYGFCNYTVNELSDTWIWVEFKKFSNVNDLNQAYQYDSSHLFGSKGLISENTFGDKSRFRVNSDDDYGAEFNPPGVYFYHLWICKGHYLIHITSRGSESAKSYIERMAENILLKI